MWRDEALLLDMLLAAQDAREFAKGLNLQSFKQCKLHQNAIVRSLEVLGEAANHVSADYRSDHPELPWAEMVGILNRLIHGYNKVSLEIVWDVVQNELPELIKKIRPLVPPDTEDGT